MRKPNRNRKRRTPVPGLALHMATFTGSQPDKKRHTASILATLATRLMAISIPKSTVGEVEPRWYHSKGAPKPEDLSSCCDEPDECGFLDSQLGWGCVSTCIVDCDSGAPLCDGWDYKPKVLASKEQS